MIISKCCLSAIYIKTTNDGYDYYCCQKCAMECEITGALLFHEPDHDTMSRDVSIKDDGHAEV